MNAQNMKTAPAVVSAKKSSMVLFLNAMGSGSGIKEKSAAVRRATTFLVGVWGSIDSQNPSVSVNALLRTGAVTVIMTDDLTQRRFTVTNREELKALCEGFQQAAKWLHTAKCVDRLMLNGLVDGEHMSGQLMAIHSERIQSAIKSGMSAAQAEEHINKIMANQPHMGLDLVFCTDQPEKNSVLGFVAPELVNRFSELELNAGILRNLACEQSIVSSVLAKMETEMPTVAPEAIPTEAVVTEVSEEATQVVEAQALSA
jgi:hypothetical protein